MTSRERVVTALNHIAPDRPPRLLYEEVVGYTPSIRKLLEAHCGEVSPSDYFHMDLSAVELNPTKLPQSRFADWRRATVAASDRDATPDEWGVIWRQGGLHHFASVESPLAGIDDFHRIRQYPWPDLDQPYRHEGVSQRVASLHKKGLAVTMFAGSIFEQAWYIRGMESLMMDMVAEPDVAHYVLDRTAYYQKHISEAMARADVDIIVLGDDVGSQRGLMISKDVWARFLKPRLAATIQAIKSARPECKVFYHSDGDIEPIISDLIEIGLDILNPVQPECMDPARIKREYGDRLSFFGTVSVQSTMATGTPDDVRNEVRDRIRTVGRNGGFILSPAHVLGPETPLENIIAFFEAADDSHDW